MPDVQELRRWVAEGNETDVILPKFTVLALLGVVEAAQLVRNNERKLRAMNMAAPIYWGGLDAALSRLEERDADA